MIGVGPADGNDGVWLEAPQLPLHGFGVGILDRAVQRVILVEQAIDKVNDGHAGQAHQLLKDQVKDLRGFSLLFFCRLRRFCCFRRFYFSHPVRQPQHLVSLNPILHQGA